MAPLGSAVQVTCRSAEAVVVSCLQLELLFAMEHAPDVPDVETQAVVDPSASEVVAARLSQLTTKEFSAGELSDAG